MSHITENLNEILNKIQFIKKENNLKQSINLIAVSKTFPSSAVKEAYDAGQRIFGENKVQEGEIKKKELNSLDIQWHLIGHLQTNKAKKAAEIFDMIHSIDSFRLAEKVSSACTELGKKMPILIQVNTSEEESKSGLNPDIKVIKEEIKKIKELSHVVLKGFMTIGPLTDDIEKVRKAFILLRSIRDEIQLSFPDLDLSMLSMGMSTDYDAALLEGATYIRVGSAIFGKRDYQK